MTPMNDKIYPTHFIDNSKLLKPLVLAWTLRYNDVLDAGQLHASLCRLLEIGDWRKLGGRLKAGKGRKLELHVPAVFTKERPAVAYTHAVFDMKIGEHPLGKELPGGTDASSVQRGPADFKALAVRPGAPANLADFTQADVPVLSLHVVSFDDATLVSITWPHVLTDASGLKALLYAWSLVLAGREDEVPRLLGAVEDKAYDIAIPPAVMPADTRLGADVLDGSGFFLFVLRMFLDIARDKTAENRTLFLSAAGMQALRDQAMLDIADESGEDGGKPFVSDGDVLVAWLSRMVARSQPKPRPVTATSAVDVRARLPEFADAQGVYVQNLLVTSATSLSPDVLAGPLGKAALANRRQITEGAHPSTVLEYLQRARKRWDDGKDPKLAFGRSDAVLLTVTDRTKADIMRSLDAGPAVLRRGEHSAAPGIAVYHHSIVLKPGLVWRNIVSVNGKDDDGNYWLTAYFPRRTWAVIEQELQPLR